MRKAMRILAVLATMFAATTAFAASGATTGPHGEKPTPASSRRADAGGGTADQGRQVYRRALVWHEMSEYTNAVNRGAQDEFKRLGITVVAQTDAGFDAARQKSDVETVLAKKPSIILSLPVDPATAANRLRSGPQRRRETCLRRQFACRLCPRQGLCDDRLRRPVPDGQQGSGRHGRSARQARVRSATFSTTPTSTSPTSATAPSRRPSSRTIRR